MPRRPERTALADADHWASGRLIASMRASTSGVRSGSTSTAPRFARNCSSFDAPVDIWPTKIPATQPEFIGGLLKDRPQQQLVAIGTPDFDREAFDTEAFAGTEAEVPT